MIKSVTLTLIAATTFQIFGAVDDFHATLPQPVDIPSSKEDIRLTRVKETLKIFGKDSRFAEPVFIAATANGIDPVLFTCLIQTESEFKISCKSSKGYVGLGQTPVAMQKQGYELVDLMLASCILKEKLQTSYSSGNMLKALQLYKGGKNKEALKYAKQVMDLYTKIKPQLS